MVLMSSSSSSSSLSASDAASLARVLTAVQSVSASDAGSAISRLSGSLTELRSLLERRGVASSYLASSQYAAEITSLLHNFPSNVSVCSGAFACLETLLLLPDTATQTALIAASTVRKCNLPLNLCLGSISMSDCISAIRFCSAFASSSSSNAALLLRHINLSRRCFARSSPASVSASSAAAMQAALISFFVAVTKHLQSSYTLTLAVRSQLLQTLLSQVPGMEAAGRDHFLRSVRLNVVELSGVSGAVKFSLFERTTISSLVSLAEASTSEDTEALQLLRVLIDRASPSSPSSTLSSHARSFLHRLLQCVTCTTSMLQRSLCISVLERCPALLPALSAAFGLSLDPRASFQWCAHVSLLQRVLLIPVLPRPVVGVEACRDAFEELVPSIISKNVLSVGLQRPSALVRSCTLALIHALLLRLDAFVRTSALDVDALREMQRRTAALLPDMQVLVRLKGVESAPASDDTDGASRHLSSSWCDLQYARWLSVLGLYLSLANVTSSSSSFDVWKLVSRRSLRASSPLCQRALLRLLSNSGSTTLRSLSLFGRSDKTEAISRFGLLLECLHHTSCPHVYVFCHSIVVRILALNNIVSLFDAKSSLQRRRRESLELSVWLHPTLHDSEVDVYVGFLDRSCVSIVRDPLAALSRASPFLSSLSSMVLLMPPASRLPCVARALAHLRVLLAAPTLRDADPELSGAVAAFDNAATMEDDAEDGVEVLPTLSSKERTSNCQLLRASLSTPFLRLEHTADVLLQRVVERLLTPHSRSDVHTLLFASLLLLLRAPKAEAMAVRRRFVGRLRSLTRVNEDEALALSVGLRQIMVYDIDDDVDDDDDIDVDLTSVVAHMAMPSRICVELLFAPFSRMCHRLRFADSIVTSSRALSTLPASTLSCIVRSLAQRRRHHRPLLTSTRRQHTRDALLRLFTHTLHLALSSLSAELLEVCDELVTEHAMLAQQTPTPTWRLLLASVSSTRCPFSLRLFCSLLSRSGPFRVVFMQAFSAPRSLSASNVGEDAQLAMLAALAQVDVDSHVWVSECLQTLFSSTCRCVPPLPLVRTHFAALSAEVQQQLLRNAVNQRPTDDRRTVVALMLERVVDQPEYDDDDDVRCKALLMLLEKPDTDSVEAFETVLSALKASLSSGLFSGASKADLCSLLSSFATVVMTHHTLHHIQSLLSILTHHQRTSKRLPLDLASLYAAFMRNDIVFELLESAFDDNIDNNNSDAFLTLSNILHSFWMCASIEVDADLLVPLLCVYGASCSALDVSLLRVLRLGVQRVSPAAAVPLYALRFGAEAKRAILDGGRPCFTDLIPSKPSLSDPKHKLWLLEQLDSKLLDGDGDREQQYDASFVLPALLFHVLPPNVVSFVGAWRVSALIASSALSFAVRSTSSPSLLVRRAAFELIQRVYELVHDAKASRQFKFFALAMDVFRNSLLASDSDSDSTKRKSPDADANVVPKVEPFFSALMSAIIAVSSSASSPVYKMVMKHLIKQPFMYAEELSLSFLRSVWFPSSDSANVSQPIHLHRRWLLSWLRTSISLSTDAAELVDRAHLWPLILSYFDASTLFEPRRRLDASAFLKLLQTALSVPPVAVALLQRHALLSHLYTLLRHALASTVPGSDTDANNTYLEELLLDVLDATLRHLHAVDQKVPDELWAQLESFVPLLHRLLARSASAPVSVCDTLLSCLARLQQSQSQHLFVPGAAAELRANALWGVVERIERPERYAALLGRLCGLVHDEQGGDENTSALRLLLLLLTHPDAAARDAAAVTQLVRAVRWSSVVQQQRRLVQQLLETLEALEAGTEAPGVVGVVNEALDPVLQQQIVLDI